MALPTAEIIGITIALGGVVANASAAILGRYVNRAEILSPLQVTTVSMGIGAVLLLGIGVSWQGLPPLKLTHWAMIGWLAIINTAFASASWRCSS